MEGGSRGCIWHHFDTTNEVPVSGRWPRYAGSLLRDVRAGGLAEGLAHGLRGRGDRAPGAVRVLGRSTLHPRGDPLMWDWVCILIAVTLVAAITHRRPR